MCVVIVLAIDVWIPSPSHWMIAGNGYLLVFYCDGPLVNEEGSFILPRSMSFRQVSMYFAQDHCYDRR